MKKTNTTFTVHFLLLIFISIQISAQTLKSPGPRRPSNLQDQLKKESTNVPAGTPVGGNAGNKTVADDPRREKPRPVDPYKYESMPNDPLKTRIYKLSNGLTVYLSQYKAEPRIQTYIATKAGSKNDPSDATGLAHYLEHLLFKGTDKYGSLDFAREKPELDKIEALYEQYRSTRDEAKRKFLYHQIDSISGVAAKSAIANEYDKMVSSLGAKGTNAFTSFEQTVYVNDIPANQIEKWLQLEAERFRNPVLRIFHTELEAVYEEKNRALDNDGRKMFEMLFSTLFPKNKYGTQTTIGTIDHLKNPSIKKIKEYFNTYYVPNNMAICLSGDLDYDATIRMIDAHFGSWPSKPVPAYTPDVEEPMLQPLVKEVFGPDAENVLVSYRIKGLNTPDADMASLAAAIMYNGTAGLIDLNLNQQQKLISGEADTYLLNDYGIFILSAKAKNGQSLEQVSELLLGEVEKLKKGEFPDWMMEAVINNLKNDEIASSESNAARAMQMVNAFISSTPWSEQVNRINRMSRITKAELVAWATKNLDKNYAIVNKRKGEDKNVEKVIKPAITPVEVNRDATSPFAKTIMDAPIKEIEPVFIDYSKDIQLIKTKSSNQIVYARNTENMLFDLYYVFDMGNNNDKKIGIAIEYLNYLGTGRLSKEQIKQEFYKLGCSYNIFTSDDQIYVNLNGLNENFEKALSTFEMLLAECKPDEEALKNLVNDMIKKRADAKLNKRVILNRALASYAKYGAVSPFTNILSEEELKSLKADELSGMIRALCSFDHEILYYGPLESQVITEKINLMHRMPEKLKAVPVAPVFKELDMTEQKVYFVNYDMKQAEIMMLSRDGLFNSEQTPYVSLFNEYFGGGMGSIVFQTMRESKALAYSVFSVYNVPQRKEKSNYIMAYIGTQSDKLPEAMAGMTDLLNNLPASENHFETSKDAIIGVIRTDRIIKAEKLFNYLSAKKLGLTADQRMQTYQKVPAMKFDELKKFHEQHYKNKKYHIAVLGNKSVLDMAALEKYGPVQELQLKDIFGY